MHTGLWPKMSKISIKYAEGFSMGRVRTIANTNQKTTHRIGKIKGKNKEFYWNPYASISQANAWIAWRLSVSE